MATTIEIDETITVGDLAERLMTPVTKLISELMKNGVMVTVNERIDFDTAQIIVGELDIDTILTRKEINQVAVRSKHVASKKAQSRPPVVAVMGHVDHGKTSLLDSIRGASVVKHEAGGITQHISAYQVRSGDRLITFLDTPGHEAFAALREHGAQLTDVVIIVIAADDGIKPQTLEAIRFAKKAGVKMIVAVNKVDKEGADVNRIKQQLSEQDLLVEEWGGDIVVVEVSAKTGQGMPELLEMILLVADVEDLRADIDIPATGLVIEAHMEQGRGPVAIALVEAGKLKAGDFVVAGTTYARIRNLESTDGQPIKEAGPSTPVVLTGFKALPEFADEFVAVNDEKTARLTANSNIEKSKTSGKLNINSTELIRMINRTNELSELNVIVKADVQGSVTSVIDSLKSIDTDEVAVRVVGSGVGTVTDNDIHLAHTSGAIIYGFNVSLPTNIRQAATRDKVSVRLFKVIYELLDDVKSEMSNLLAPEVIEAELGRLIVKAIFKTTKTEVICGGEVTKGKLSLPAIVKVTRDDNLVAQAEVTNLKRGPHDAKEVIEGEMCGVSLKSTDKLDVQVGDRLEFVKREVVERTL